jgi:NTP pyrophosphatase (non-canonical NTP hydrolase)
MKVSPRISAAATAATAVVSSVPESLTLAEYAPLARVTLKELPYTQHMDHMGMGVVGELGEFTDLLKKYHLGKGVDPSGARNSDGTPVVLRIAEGGVFDKVNASEEGGDAWWYVVNYLPELQLTTNDIEPAFAYGFSLGRAWSDSPAKLIFQACAQVAKAAGDLSTDYLPDEVFRKAAMQVMARNLGALYGFHGLDLGQSLARNIAKLEKRHGKKFSETAGLGLGRDLNAERTALEGGAA